MPKDRIALAQLRLTESAFDFLSRSIDEIKAHPKYSVIHFSTAIELLLKSRLMNEHWSLVVDRISDADLENFLSGKCKTVGQAEAVKRLAKVCGEPLSKDATLQFEKIAAHRNRMIHFFHEIGEDESDPNLVADIVKEQCLSWFYLERMLSQWNDQFADFEGQIAHTRWKMRGNRAYLTVVFDQLSPKIEEDKKAGTVFHSCSGCGYVAAEVSELSDIMFEQSCRICRLSENYVEINCPAECGEKINIKADHGSDRTCAGCGHEITSSELSDILSTEYIDHADHIEMNCAFCGSSGTVVQHHEIYVCVECLSFEDGIKVCEWCSEGQIGGGDLEYSYHTGCEFCDGHSGWTKDD